MAADHVLHAGRPTMTDDEVLAYIKHEFQKDADDAQRQAADAGLLPTDSATGMTLDLSHKNIRALPVEVIGLIKDKVERLALSHNPQISVPSQIVQCDRLRYLNIRWNQLTQFPETVLQLSKLEILDLSKNRITSVPEGIKRMTSLKFLAVARNKITRLPLALGDMPSLSKLKFDENPLVFPPREEISRPSSSGADAGEERDVCQQVKRYLKQQSMRQRVVGKPINGDDEMNESNVETPRPPRRVQTGGRFPIRPSISGIDALHSPMDHIPHPIPQRSHARVASTNGPVIIKRPGVAPLLTNGNDISRSRSETASSSASLRQRRQGFVPVRKPTPDFNRLNEASRTGDNRSSSASTIKADHSRQSSTASAMSGFLTASSGGSSSGAVSPVDGPVHRFGYGSRLSSLPENRNSAVQPNNMVKAAKRLKFTLAQLNDPVQFVVTAIKDSTPQRSTLERRLFTATAQLNEVGRLLDRAGTASADSTRQSPDAMEAIARACIIALKAYGALTAELRRSTSRILTIADGIFTRSLMFQLYASMVEAKNLCTVLGFKVEHRVAPSEPARASTAWSSKTVTPTQSKPPISSSRMRGATIIRDMASSSTLRAMPEPPVPSSANSSRTNTMTSVSSIASSAAPTPRSGESFSSMFPPARPDLSRSNTMRSVTHEGEDDYQFHEIYRKLSQACDLATQALTSCHAEFTGRKHTAQVQGSSNQAGSWTLALKACDTAIGNCNALRKRLGNVRINEPNVHRSREFWQLCDGFVHSWTDLATQVKEIGSYRVDISTAKAFMRQTQKAVRDVSRSISASPLYHQAIPGTRPPDSAGSHGGYGGSYPANQRPEAFRTHSEFMGPATPLSAALGPAAQATVASTANGNGGYGQRDYVTYNDQNTSRRRPQQPHDR